MSRLTVGRLTVNTRKGTLAMGRTTIPLAGLTVEADVLDAGSRITATRLAVLGPLALALRKNKRVGVFTVTFPNGNVLVEQFDPKDVMAAKRLAAAAHVR